ncbi:MAG TPA: HAD-IA family hydrolase [Gaiellaceae bacterium]|jgi:putative hydrolase of the HAD superfamily
MPSASELDAVTVDAFRTLVDLSDPVPALAAALRARGEERSDDAVRQAFQTEVAYYLPRAHTGRDEASLLALRTECARVFLTAAAAPVDPVEFVPDFVGSLEFRVLPGGAEALDRLRSAGLALACVANWDSSLGEYLGRAGVADRFDAVVSSAEAEALKPDPRIFRLALERLGVPPERALHVGDDEVDREGAAAAGMSFEPVPLETLPARLGIGAP